MASATDATPVREKVAVLGLGRLGLCFAVVLEQAGYDVGGHGRESEHCGGGIVDPHWVHLS